MMALRLGDPLYTRRLSLVSKRNDIPEDQAKTFRGVLAISHPKELSAVQGFAPEGFELIPQGSLLTVKRNLQSEVLPLLDPEIKGNSPIQTSPSE